MNHQGTKAPRWFALSLLSWCLGSFLFAAEVDISKLPPPDSRKVDFATHIKPLFEASCFRCHGEEKPKGKYSLATREAALKGGNEGIDIIPGDSAKSPLIHYVARLVPEMEMPPVGKGEPLTREQIALLRAWIDQGVAWEETDPGSQYQPRFSFTPAVRYVTVSGNARKFEEHQWVRRGFSGGASDFRVAEKRTDGTSIVVEGRALTDDFKVTLDIRKEDVGFVRTGFEQFRRYYDDRGPYYRFRPTGFATATPGNFGLHRDLELDIASAFVEFGLTLPKWPSAVLGYELHTRHGNESTEQWGPVTYGSASGPFTKNIYPAFQHNDHDVHILRLDVAYDVAGTHIEDNARVEFSDLDNRRTSAILFPAGAASPAAFAITRETHDEIQFANALHGEKSVREWLFVSAGYLFTRFDADATLSQQLVDGSGQTVSAPRGGATDIVLKESAHVFNANVLLGPWDGFTASVGLLNEWSDQTGFGHQNLTDTDPDDPTGGAPRELALVASDIDRLITEENVMLRYTTIPATVLFAETRLRQERSDKFEELNSRQALSLHDEFLRDTDQEIDWQEYQAGFQISPWRQVSLHTSYKHRRHHADYNDERDRLPTSANPLDGAGYPAFIRSRETESDSIETRLALRPFSWLKASLSYRLSMTDYDAATDRGPTFQSTTPAGHIFAGEHDSATYSFNLSLTPMRRWYFSTTLSYQESETWTADHGNPSVAPYRGDIWSVVASSTFALSAQTDLTGSYSFSRARFGQHDVTDGVPLGIDYDLHSVQFGMAHRLNAHLTTSLQYGFFQYDEPTAQGFNDYAAHMFFGTLAVRFP